MTSSAADVSQRKHLDFPLSPPSSGNVTAVSSPKLHNNQSNALNHHFTFSSTRYNPKFHLPFKKLQKPPVVPDVLDSGDLSSSFSTHGPFPRSFTLSPDTSAPPVLTSAFPPATLSRADSASSVSSTSSSSIIHMRENPHTPSSGMGRKVAAKLQLFKESVGPTDDTLAGQPSRPSSSGGRRTGHSKIGDDEEIADAQFKFVKRSEWPDREAAAIRRERSMTTLEHAKVREGDLEIWEGGQQRDHKRYREGVLQEYNRWRRGFVRSSEAKRGRRRDRMTADPEMKEEHVTPKSSRNEVNTPCQSPHTFPPSPSPSRSPRRSLISSQQTQQSDSSDGHPHPSPWAQPASDTFEIRPRLESHSNSHTASLSAPSSPVESTSPWSTDDDSTWETASITTSTSTTPSITARRRRSRSPVLLHDTSEDADLQSPRNSFVFREKDSIHSLHFDLSHEHLPHIPLRPFRNQVGGHSSIYKFTKQAVCKPLVSRENLFYEAVEREAPPLLGFIPRYLGVMLVSYRRVPKTRAPNGVDKPVMVASLDSSKSDQPILRPPSPVHVLNRVSSPPASRLPDDVDTDEAELPEVVLDRNRHIIPEWMLKSNRIRSKSQSFTNGTSVFAHVQSHAENPHHSTTSSPDLATPTVAGSVSFEQKSLDHYSTFESEEMDAPTPVNSPSRASHAFPTSLAERPYPITRDTASDDDGDVSCPYLRPFHSENALPGSPWGTGSTVVNTKLKDHVFQNAMHSAFRRVKKLAGCTRNSQTEDESEFPTEGGGSRRRSKKPRAFPGITKSHSDGCRTPVRRVQSEAMLGGSDHAGASNQAQGKDSGNISGVFEMDLDLSHEGPGSVGLLSGVNLSPLLSRHRSHLRSDASPMHQFPSHPPPPDHTTITEQFESDPSFTRQNHFILMEDLTGRLKHPCVMDLKMGTRQYGLDATSSKKKSQRKKCDRTTSRALGVRVCGMQVWNVAKQSYSIQDKYSGREVRPEEFDSVLASFLSNGERLLVHQIPVLLQKLYALARIVNRLKGYRFYGCSLLLIYDGDSNSQEAFRSWALEHPSSKSKRGESLERRSRTRHEAEKATLRRSHSEDLLAGPVAKRSSGKRKRGEVNVRIVDFAHTTTGRDWLPYSEEPLSARPQDSSSSKGYQAEFDPETGYLYARFPPHYPDQPDRGFLFGLKNLTSSLERIWNEERILRVKVSRDDPYRVENQLTPLPTEGNEIFKEIFGDEDDGMISS